MFFKRTIAISIAVICIGGLGSNIVLAQVADTIPPSTPAGLTVTPVQPSAMTLSWVPSTDNVGVAGYKVYRNGAFVTTVNTTSYIDGGLAPGGYGYAIAAFDAAGNVSMQSASIVGVLVLDTTPPSQPTGLTAAPVSSSTASFTSVALLWTASTDNIGVKGYFVYRNGTLLTTSTPWISTAYTDSVTAGTYAYRVAAYDAAGNVSDQSLPATATIISDTTAPSIPTGLVAEISPQTPSRVTLSWLAATDNVGVAGYAIYRNNAQIATTASTTYADVNLAPAGYTYAVAAYDAAGNASFRSGSVSVVVVQDTMPPSVPNGLTPALTPLGIGLSWNPSLDNVYVSGYYVYRGGAQISNTTTTSYLDTGVASGTYAYAVAAYDSSNNLSGQSSPASITFASLPAAIPANTAATSSAASAVPANALATASSSATSAGTVGTITISLRLGAKNAQVKILQTFLMQKGYLREGSLTGFFGKMTEQAVKKFQCDKGIVCRGNPHTTGWGSVGVKTRAALNN